MNDPIDAAYRDQMNALARALDRQLNGTGPRKVGFALFMFEFGRTDHGRVNYISNADRAGMLTAVREWLARAEGRVIESETKQ